MMDDTKERILGLLKSTERPGIDKVMEFLEQSDFFTAPASTKYHSSYEGGLANHSLNVYKVFEHKNRIYKLELPIATVIICGLLHDICKVDFYKKGSRNVKENGQWVAKEIWEVDEKNPLGHGEKSVIILMGYIQLTPFEIAAIRWHMGAWEGKDNSMSLSNAMDMFPGIVALQTADMESSNLIEKKGVEG
jgi:hypothetical protein